MYKKIKIQENASKEDLAKKATNLKTHLKVYQ